MATTITMTEQELSKLDTINQLIAGSITPGCAAEQLGLSGRHIRRLRQMVVDGKARNLAHKGRGKASNRKIPQTTIDEAAKLLREKYPDFKPTFAAEKLRVHDISLSKEKVRQLMAALGLWKPKKRKENGEHRAWRPRKERYGAMEQFDGSYHRWFEDRAGECCLLASIDDAKGTITHAEFGESESVVEVASFWKSYLLLKGKPISVYLDKYSTYKVNHKNAKDNHELMTQFQRMMKELDINLITAHSPEAKGRIERLFGTLQDRLVKELRLAGISTIREANVFLKDIFIPAFNTQFGVVPVDESDAHRTLSETEKMHLDAIFSVQEKRKVGNDFTVRFENQWLQLGKVQPCLVCRNDLVLLEKRLDGTLHMRLRDKYLVFKILPERPQKDKERATALVPKKERTPWIPSANHPWKKPFLISKSRG
jgi:transposase InsO family protein